MTVVQGVAGNKNRNLKNKRPGYVCCWCARLRACGTRYRVLRELTCWVSWRVMALKGAAVVTARSCAWLRATIYVSMGWVRPCLPREECIRDSSSLILHYIDSVTHLRIYTNHQLRVIIGFCAPRPQTTWSPLGPSSFVSIITSRTRGWSPKP
jgi:hypothetical protein